MVYLSQMDGKDTNSGEKDSPVQTLAKAISKLKNGGTVVLVNGYESKDAVLSVPNCSGPLLITAEHNNVVLYFKFIRLNGDVYFRIHRPGQNLDRARTQFALLADMERHQAEMADTLRELYL